MKSRAHHCGAETKALDDFKMALWPSLLSVDHLTCALHLEHGAKMKIWIRGKDPNLVPPFFRHVSAPCPSRHVIPSDRSVGVLRRTEEAKRWSGAEMAVGVLDTVLVKVQPHLPSNMVAEHSSMAVDVPIPQIRKEIWEVIQLILRERIPNHVVEQIVEVAKDMPDERLQQGTAGQIVKMTVAEIAGNILLSKLSTCRVDKSWRRPSKG